MTKNVYRIAGLAVVVGAVMVVGAGSPKNKQAGLPVILSQPVDQLVAPKKDAIFKVKAKGENLTYKWLFQNSDEVIVVGKGPELVVPGSKYNRYGKYWCLIESEGMMGVKQVGTYKASLTEPLALGSLSTNVSQGTMTISPGGTTCCPSCGYINFYNSNVGWPLTGGVIVMVRLSLSPAMSPLIDPSEYCVRYRYGGGANQAGCFTGSTFTPPVTGTYFFTVYRRTGCPASGTLHYLDVSPPL
jgi:hypothetical protein